MSLTIKFKLINRDKKVQKRDSNNLNKQRVISYYTASRRQIDQFERTSGALNFDQSKRRRKVHSLLRHWSIGVACLIIVISVGYLLTLSQQPLIEIAGPRYRSMTTYKSMISPILKSDFRNHFKYLLQTKKIKVALYEQLPEATSIEIGTNLLGRRPTIIIETALPMAVFLQPGKSDYVINNRGKILMNIINSDINKSNLVIIQNQSSIEGKQGMQYIKPDEALALETLIVQYKNPEVTSLVSFSLNDIPHEITAREPGRGYAVKYLLDENIKVQYGALRATEQKLKQINQKPIEYIDVRLADKVYYR